MIARYALGVIIPAAVLLAVALWWQSGRVDALELENASLARSVAALDGAREQARLAAEVAKASADREREANAETSAAIERLLITDFGDCADEILDPALGDILNGL